MVFIQTGSSTDRLSGGRSLASDFLSVEYKEKLDGSWAAIHTPSGRVVHGLTRDEAHDAMQKQLGFNDDGGFDDPETSERFSGMAYDIAVYIEGPVSKMLELHSGYARLEAYADGVCHVRLGGGCQGCPSSLLTLTAGVKRDLQHHFGEEVVADVVPVFD